MKNNFFTLALLSAFALASCQKISPLPIKSLKTGLSAIVVPVGFTWENSKTITLTTAVVDNRFGNALSIISVYDADPALGGHLLAKGSASPKNAFISKFYLSKTYTSVFIVKIAPDNSFVSKQVAITGNNIGSSMGI